MLAQLGQRIRVDELGVVVAMIKPGHHASSRAW